MNILVTDLYGICYMTSPTTDLSRIHDTILVHTDLTEICHRADSTADLGEFCCKSYVLPDPLIPALPSYELAGLPASCAFRPMTLGSCLHSYVHKWHYHICPGQ